MTITLEQIYGLLTAPPGNLAYYLALSFTVMAALQASLHNFRRTGFPQGSRMLTGLTLLLLVQLAQFAVAGLAWLDLLDPGIWLAPVDRTILLFSSILVVWLWLAPEPSRLLDITFGILLFLSAGFLGVSISLWKDLAALEYFNLSAVDISSNWIAMLILGFGSLGLLLRRPNGWGIGLAMLALLFSGQLVHALQPTLEGDFSGPIRLAQLMAFPWLMTLPQRFPFAPGKPSPVAEAKVAERRRYASDPQVFQEFVGLLDQPADCQTITRLVSHLMLADLCLLVSTDSSDNNLIIACGYNLIEERWVDGFSIEGHLAPMIANALKRGKPLRLPSSSTSADLQALATGLKMTRVGHLLSVPITAAGTVGLVLLSPFSNRGWGSEDQSVLSKFARYLEHVLQPTSASTPTPAEPGALSAAAGEEKNRLQAQVEALQADAAQAREHSESLAALLSSQQMASPSANAGPSGETALQAAPVEMEISPQAYEDLEMNLRFALEQVAELRQELAKVSSRTTAHPLPPSDQASEETQLAPLEFESPPVTTIAGDAKTITGIVKELDQPVNSILGYTDLLLGESTGILNPMQRKYLERIRIAMERMGGLIDDLLQAFSFSQDEFKFSPREVNLVPLITAAVQDAKDYLQEKEIRLQIDIPEELPTIFADETSLRRAVTSLLRKAGDSSRRSGDVRLKARVEAEENETSFVMLQVFDSSDGIPVQELPRVFSRVYSPSKAETGQRSKNGMDLATVKAVIEAHGGRIWVDSTLGEGSTYSALLPIPGR